MKEILIFDPDTDTKHLNSITATLKKKNYSKGKQAFSVSIGAATYLHKDISTRADTALFKAKCKGRSRVVVY